MVKKKLQICCSSTLAMLLIVCFFVSGIVHAEEPLTQADELLKSKKYDQAKALFQSAAQNSSDSSLAIKGLTGVGRCEIQLDNNAAAEQVIETLKKDYSQHPDLCARLDDLSYEYWQKADYAKSKVLCQYIIQKSPADSLAVRVQRGIARAEIRLGNKAAADQAVAVLMNDFSQHKDLCEQLSVLSYEYFWKADYVKSKALWQYIAQKTSDSDLGIEARTKMIVCDARLGNDSAAEQAIAELKNDYPNALKQIAMCEYELGHLAAAEWATNERLVKFPDDTECFDILNKVARSYQKNEDHEKSIELYQRVLASSTDQNQQLWSVRGIAVSSAWLGGDEEVLSKVNFICNNFKTHRIAGKSIFIIGEQYYFKGVKAAAQSNKELAKDYCQKAISIWNKNITEINDPHYICLATYFTAVALEQTGKHEDAISYYKKTLQDFPDYDKAWNAQYRIARCYDQMCKRKLISKDEAGTYISQACQKVKENYPDCKVINFAEKLNKKYQTEVVK